ncbi:Double Clp-N motif-containing P-loop nucleoside triphosphate hydrolases superfamily protein [Striga hermonthica]|uniref:Double Clp-N motif-containing P-loop nucleoside triphosphate hydrolases superfamily protein n=1 Tax=Striga hermonthica TaxID=68872 RepID=A0A9N7RP13_STRHE|nr:Double Clp-N motif-containing P-loop nucleoside triphosphate hydrolases superfamily protein [Striga hermonthica]
MPTPVDVARQCLAESAAAVLDDAVAVAKRRSHAQTTSLHIVSALLALPSSILREACSRIRSSACSPRLQFRALELSVGVALDRVSVSKSAGGDEPPVSNSLMAAIKRSQANQRRHPETFHLYQHQLGSDPQTPPSISGVKVEMKHFVLSILDDPTVSRVLGDGGFQTHEVKMAILNPLTTSRFSSSAIGYRPPPLFPGISLGNLDPGISFPFSQLGAGTERADGNSRRIAEILAKSSRRNPLLVGVHASDAHRVFIDCLKKGESGVLPREIDGLNVVSIEHEITGCSKAAEGLEEEIMRLKFKQVDEMVKECKGPGVIVNCGDLKVFVDAGSETVVSYMLSELKRLVMSHGRKLWLIGFLSGDGDYKKLLERFPSIEMDLDLHLLPITTASTSENSFKSSLLRSFVPLGGFFSMPSENEGLSTSAAKTSGLCYSCNEKYEREIADVSKGVSTSSLAAKELGSLPSWMQVAESKTREKSLTAEAKEDKSVLDARVMASKRKWTDICRRIHSSSAFQKDINQAMPSNTSNSPSFQSFFMQNDAESGVGSLLSGRSVTNFVRHPGGEELSRPIVPSKRVNTQANLSVRGLEMSNLHHSSPSVATNLRLGAMYDSATEENTKKLNETPSVRQISQSSPSLPYHFEKKLDSKDHNKHTWAALAQKVYWQSEAVQTIARAVSRCRSENGNGNAWLSLLGPDRAGKRKIASGVAEIEFGRKENFLSVDLNSRDSVSPISSVFNFHDSKQQKLKLGRKMIVDYLAEELSKHPHSVVLLENVERADFLVRDSLCRAIKTGKFPNSHGREIIINNNIFLLASPVLKATEGQFSDNKSACEFLEDKILEARNLHMQILVGPHDPICGRTRSSTMNVSITASKILSKRKSSDSHHDSTSGQLSKRSYCRSPRSFIDLNLPVEDCENFVSNNDENDESDGSLEELLEHVDGNVAFKPFDFDSLGREILTDIDAQLKKAVGPTVFLEIDREVLLQILAASWLAADGGERKNALGDWVENVLCPGLEEARQRYGGAHSRDVVMKLVPCDDGRVVEEAWAAGLCLPARINLD